MADTIVQAVPAVDNRPFWKTKTFWGCVLVGVAAATQAAGLTGIASQIGLVAGILGVPFTVYAVADRLR